MYRVLIAEDEFIERMMMKKSLEKRFGESCEVIEAENGKAALEISRRRDIHIALLDIEMPGMKGLDVAEILRKEKKEISIIFITAYDKFEYLKKAISVHALDYLLKPYSMQELTRVVKEALHLAEEIEKREDKSRVENILTDNYEADAHPENTKQEEGGLKRLDVLVEMAEEYVRNNYMREISVEEVARAIHYSEPYFCKMFKQQCGRNFMAYLTEYRMEAAKKLLMQPKFSIKEIGNRIGYPDSSYFARVFRRMVGISPSQYRSNLLKELKNSGGNTEKIGEADEKFDRKL